MEIVIFIKDKLNFKGSCQDHRSQIELYSHFTKDWY